MSRNKKFIINIKGEEIGVGVSAVVVGAIIVVSS